MKLIVGILFLFSLTTLTSSAEELTEDRSYLEGYREFELPKNFEKLQGGYPESPVIPCPRPAERYSNLAKQLSSIENKIKSEVCTEKDTITGNLKDLVSKDRQKFIELVKQGAFGQGQLDDDQLFFVKNYVEEIVTKAADITGLLNRNEICFDDEDRQSTLSFLSSVVGEVSGAIGSVAGPFGAKISLGGAVAESLLKSVDMIREAQNGYDFNKIEEINNYFNNLCTYYDLKADLDKESNLFDSIGNLEIIINLADGYLTGVTDEGCGVCQKIVEDYNVMKKNGELVDHANYVEPRGVIDGRVYTSDDDSSLGEPYVPDRVKPAPTREAPSTRVLVDAEPISEEPEELDAPIVEEAASLGVTIANATQEELVALARERYADQIAAEKMARDADRGGRSTLPAFESGDGVVEEPVLEAPVIEAPVIVEEAGSDFGDIFKFEFREPSRKYTASLDEIDATIRAWRVQNWARDERDRLNEIHRENMEQDGRKSLTKEQRRIEKFLVNKEAPRYIDHITKQLKKDIRRLRAITNILNRPMPRLQYEDDNQPPKLLWSPLASNSFDMKVANWQMGLGAIRLYTELDFDERVLAEALDIEPDEYFQEYGYFSVHRKDFGAPIRSVYHNLWKGDLNIASIIDEVLNEGNASTYGVSEIRIVRKELKRVLEESLTDMLQSFGLVLEKCEFFKNSMFQFNNSIDRACERGRKQMGLAQFIVGNIQETAFYERNYSILDSFDASRPNYVSDWEESVIYALARDARTVMSDEEVSSILLNE